MRTAPYFHNMVGILTETGAFLADDGRLRSREVPARRFANGESTSEPSTYYPNPFLGGHLALPRQLRLHDDRIDGGARHRRQEAEEWLYDIYRMGRDAIEQATRETYVMSRRAVGSGNGGANW